MAKIEFIANEDGAMLVIDGQEVKKIYAEDLYCALFDHEMIFQENRRFPINSREMLLEGVQSAINDFLPSWEKTRDKNW